MEDTTKKEQFIELRAKGRSFQSIADELGVSKTTLIDWSKALSEEIGNLRAIETEALIEKYKISKMHRLKLYSEQLEKIRQELASRKLSDIPTAKLIDMQFKIAESLCTEEIPIQFSKTSANFDLEPITTKSSWSA